MARMGDLNDLVAGNLRRARAARGMSQADVARHGGLSKGTLAQLESGKANPTIETLNALAGVLGVPCTYFISEPAEDTAVVVRSDEGVWAHGDHMDLRTLHQFVTGGSLVEFYEMRIPAGAEHLSPGVATPAYEHLIVQEGALLAGPRSRPTRVEAGDYICFGSDVPHIYRAEDGAAASALMMIHYPANGERLQHGAQGVSTAH